MLIVADQNLPLLERTFGRHAELRLRPGRDMGPADLAGADVLLVKSITRVNRALLQGGEVRFVGSATIGHDHLDLPWLEANHITWATAPGCNARAAAQYSLAMYLLACRRLGRSARDATAAVIGRGNVGSRVLRALQALRIDSVACDPPLADQGVTGLVSMEEALERDVIFVHVPLTRDGPCPTYRMFDRNILAAMGEGAMLINSARGDVVDGAALLAELHGGRLHAALDVWPEEPELDPDLLAAATVGTPHVAGYSQQGRLAGALMIYHAFCRWAGQYPVLEALPDPPKQELRLANDGNALHDAVIQSTGVARDDEALREAVRSAGARRGAAFDALRRDYPIRHEFRHWRIVGAHGDAARALDRLGFSLG